jgi:hypothetical protein
LLHLGRPQRVTSYGWVSNLGSSLRHLSPGKVCFHHLKPWKLLESRGVGRSAPSSLGARTLCSSQQKEDFWALALGPLLVTGFHEDVDISHVRYQTHVFGNLCWGISQLWSLWSSSGLLCVKPNVVVFRQNHGAGGRWLAWKGMGRGVDSRG